MMNKLSEYTEHGTIQKVGITCLYCQKNRLTPIQNIPKQPKWEHSNAYYCQNCKKYQLELKPITSSHICSQCKGNFSALLTENTNSKKHLCIDCYNHQINRRTNKWT